VPDPDSPDSATTVDSAPTADDATTATLPPSNRGRARGSRTVGDMIRSLLVVGGIVALLVLIVPRPSAVSQPPIDVPGTAQGAAADAQFPLAVPRGLPPDWKATSAQLLTSVDNVQTWHVGYETSSAQYAALEQAKNVTTNWVRTNSGGGNAVGQQLVGGTTWTQLLHENRLQRTLLLTTGAMTVMVTGTASWEDLGKLAASISPAP
jgi:hypothetical protein